MQAHAVIRGTEDATSRGHWSCLTTNCFHSRLEEVVVAVKVPTKEEEDSAVRRSLPPSKASGKREGSEGERVKGIWHHFSLSPLPSNTRAAFLEPVKQRNSIHREKMWRWCLPPVLRIR